MLLNSTTDLVQVVTTAAGDIDVHAYWADLNSGVVTVDRKNTTATTATTTTVVPSPAASTARKVKTLNITNAHASVTNTVTIQHVDATAGVTSIIDTVPLLPGERVAYREGVPMRVLDANGIEKTNVRMVSGASTVAQIASHSADTYYLGFPITGRVQAGSHFVWTVKGLSKTAGTAAPVFTVRVGTAGTTADTSRAAVTLGAQTAVVDQGEFEVTAVFRAVGAAAQIRADVSLEHNLLVTGFATTPAGHSYGGNTGGTFDSTTAGLIIGLSVNPGAAGAWVVENCVLDAVNLIP